MPLGARGTPHSGDQIAIHHDSTAAELLGHQRWLDPLEAAALVEEQGLRPLYLNDAHAWRVRERKGRCEEFSALGAIVVFCDRGRFRLPIDQERLDEIVAEALQNDQGRAENRVRSQCGCAVSDWPVGPSRMKS